jgi:hypothetical protein
MILSGIKLLYDICFLVIGAIYFWRFRSLKKKIESENRKQREKKKLGP